MAASLSGRLIAAGLAAGALGASCAREGTPTVVHSPTIVASVWALAWVAETVAPDAVVVRPGRGREPHDLELSPGERADFEGADVVVYLGPLDFQPVIEELVAESGAQVVSAADHLATIGLIDHEGQPITDPSRSDPHVWLDAESMARVAEALGEALGRADPAASTRHMSRAAEVASVLEQVARERDAAFAGCLHDEVIVSHAAFAYILAPVEITQIGLAPVGDPEAGASPARLAELTQLIRDRRLPAVVTDLEAGRRDAETLAREADVALLEASTLEVVSDADEALGLPDLLRRNYEVFAEAAGCTP